MRLIKNNLILLQHYLLLCSYFDYFLKPSYFDYFKDISFYDANASGITAYHKELISMVSFQRSDYICNRIRNVKIKLIPKSI